MSSGIIDLRPGRSRKPSPGQRSLFVPRSSRGRDTPPRRPLPLRARRRRIRFGIGLGLIVIVAALGYGIHYVSYLPQFSIQHIAVSGTENVSPQLISDYVQSILDDGSYHFLSRANIFVYPRAVIEEDVVLDFPRVASAVVSRPTALSTTLDVTISERQLFALWCDDVGTCYDMDQGGFIYAQGDMATTSSLYVFSGGVGTTTQPIGQTFATTHLSSIRALLTELGQAGFVPQGAAIQNNTDFSVPLSQGFFLKASFGESPDDLVKNLQLVLNSEALQGKEDQLEYVDLRFGDRVYYKLQGQEETSDTPQ